MTTTECISLHLGQAGVNLASPVWDFLCEEEGIMVDGTVNRAKVRGDWQCSSAKFFNSNAKGRHTARALAMDMDPEFVQCLRRGCLRRLFSGPQLLTHTTCAGNNYAAGRYMLGGHCIGEVMEHLRRLVEQCDALQDFIIYNAMGGGTGSGFTALLLERLSQEYGKTGKIQYAITSLPGFQKAPSETYNNLLHIAATADLSDIVVLFDNEALVGRCRLAMGIKQPHYETLNQIVANVVSSTTLPMRTGNGKYGTKQLASELVPYPGMRYPIASFAPVTSVKYVEETSDELWEFALEARDTLSYITQACFTPQKAMVTADVRLGKSMAVVMAYRGEIRDTYYIPDPVASAWIHPNHESVGWLQCYYRHSNSPSRAPTLATTRTKGALAQLHMTPHKRALCVLNNNTAMVNLWARHLVRHESLMKQRKFYHLYTNVGMEEEEFEMAREHAESLVEEFGAVDF